MKRIISVAAVAVLVVTPAVGHAAKKPKRVERKVTFAFTGFCSVGVNGGNARSLVCPNAQVNETVRKGEAYVKYFVTDDTGKKVGLTGFDPGAYSSTAESTCGGLTKFRKMKAGTKISIITMADPTCEGPPTKGTLTMIFSNLP